MIAAAGADVSVAVVSYNTRDTTLRCLQAAEAAAPAAAALTLVDNGSSDGTVERVRSERPRWRVLVLADNPGYGAALNRAFATAPARFCLALNADVLLEPRAVGVLAAFLDRTPACALAGPALRYPDGGAQPSAKRFPDLAFAVGETLAVHALFPANRSVRRFYYADRDLSAAPAAVDAVSGAAMLIRGDAFRAVGGFDEGFRLYFEETDLCRRLRARGFTVCLVPAAAAVHAHGASSRQTTVRQVEYYLSYVRYFRKHHGRAAAVALALAVAAGTLARMLALLVKYPPVVPRRAALLAPRLAACARLLRGLRGVAGGGRAAGARP